MSVVAFLLKREQPDAVELCRRLVESLRVRGTGETAVVISDREAPEAPRSIDREAPEAPRSIDREAPEAPRSIDREAPVSPFEGVDMVAETELPHDLRLLVVLGGDGTLLYGANLLRGAATPILGVNLGHLGFLTACSPGQAVEGLNAALSGQLVIEERQRLRCRVLRPVYPPLGLPHGSRDGLAGPHRNEGNEAGKVEVIVEREAVNEIVLSQPQQARLFELEAFVDGEQITTYKADGLIVSTPTGSTAYNLAAGGPILTPQLKALVLTPICPHTLTARPLVAPLSSCIEVRQGRNAVKVMLTIDGQWNIHLGERDFVELTCAPAPLRIYRAKNRSFFDLLRTKLHWGVRE